MAAHFLNEFHGTFSQSRFPGRILHGIAGQKQGARMSSSGGLS